MHPVSEAAYYVTTVNYSYSKISSIEAYTQKETYIQFIKYLLMLQL